MLIRRWTAIVVAFCLPYTTKQVKTFARRPPVAIAVLKREGREKHKGALADARADSNIVVETNGSK